MSASIKNLSTFIDNRMININFQGNKLVSLSGDESNKDTILYTLERFFAQDFGSYYDEIDSNLGVSYKKLEGNSTLKYVSGISTYSDLKLQNRGTLPYIHCIRYINKDRIRSFIIDSNVTSEVIGTNMTVFSSVISDSKWSRLATLVNNLVGYECVKLDIKSRKLSFDIHSYKGWSEETIKFVYLLISESMLTPDKYTRVILLSEIDILSTEQVAKLIKTLSSISRNEMIVFSNNLPNDSLGFSNKVLNLNV